MLRRSPCCLYICILPPIKFWMPEPIFMKLWVHIMAPEPISTAYLINPSHQSVCLSCASLLLLGKGPVKFILPFVARQRLGKHVPAATNIRKNRKIVGHSRDNEEMLEASFSMWSVSCQESRRLILPRTSCYNLHQVLSYLSCVDGVIYIYIQLTVSLSEWRSSKLEWDDYFLTDPRRKQNRCVSEIIDLFRKF
jgi:hypothetical protein